MEPDGRLAVVVGGTRGIGLATARALLRRGCRVVATSRHGTPLPDLPVRHCDVRSTTGVHDAFAAVEADFGTPDIVVANAAVRSDALLGLQDEAEFAATLDTNLTGAWRVADRALPGLVKSSAGRLVFLSSPAAVRGEAAQCGYAASKAGLHGLARSLAGAGGGSALTVNVVMPGLVDTAMTADLTPRGRKRILDRTPLGRAGLPEEIAAVICFLAGRESAYITGAVIPVDGGLSMGL